MTDDTNTLVFEIYTDWVNWIENGVDGTTFAVPSACPLSSNTSPFPFFRNVYLTIKVKFVVVRKR